MSYPRVTVVVPNYNHVRFLAQRLDSILAQTYTDWEMLYLDDASTDASADVFARYADDPRVRAIVNTQNTGSPFVQWNRGVREAQGEYVWIAEADDYADVHLLETLVLLLDNNPNLGLAYCQSLRVDEQSNTLGSCAEWGANIDPTHWTKDFIQNGRDECRSFLVRNCTLPNASAVLFRKSMYEQAGGADESMRACGDWLLYAKILLISDVAFSSAALNFFRQHPSSVTRKAESVGLGIQESYQVVSFIVKNVTVDAQALRLSCDTRMTEWRKVLLSGQNRISWQRNLAIYRLARRLDTRLPLRLAKLLLMLAARTVLPPSLRPTDALPRRMSGAEQ